MQRRPDDRTDIARITAFDHRFARAQATDVVELAFGFAVLNADFPLSEYHNRIAVTGTATAPVLLARADAILGDRGMRHRYVSVDDDNLGRALVPAFVAAGYEHEVIATMIYSRAGIEPPAHEVRVVSFDAVRPTMIREWADMVPDAPEEHLRQLVDRTTLYSRGAELTRLAVYDGDALAAHADLFVDHDDHIAQFENLATQAEFRGRGYGRALVCDALQRGRSAGGELSCLTADVGDWPREWYRRLGYADAGRTHHFSRHA
jgi:ribosomal protein S18 acetylase RimI-like enzyme